MTRRLFSTIIYTKILILLFVCSAITGYSNTSFSIGLENETTTQVVKKGKKNKKAKKTKRAKRKRILSLFKDMPNKYGTISVWTLVGAMVSMMAFIPLLALLFFVISCWAAWYGTKHDENKKRAEIMLTIYLLLFGAFMLIFGWALLLSTR